MSYSNSLDYPLEIDNIIYYPGGSKENWKQRQLGNHKRADWAWRWSKVLFDFAYKNGFVVIKKKKDGTSRIYTKTYENVKIEKTDDGYDIVFEDRTKATSSIEFTQNIYSNDNAKKDLKKLGLEKSFDYSKPVNLIKEIINYHKSKSATVLDFFAGSGTTAQAVLELNKKDGGNRKFILCTNNENNICEEVTYERIKRVIYGYADEAGLPANLKYFKTDFIAKDADDVSEALLSHIKEMVELENGITLDNKHDLIVVSDEEADELARHWSDYEDVKAIYLSRNVLFTSEQNALFSNTEIHIIPDYYFEYELKEVGETW